jgi:hypothetical protein
MSTTPKSYIGVPARLGLPADQWRKAIFQAIADLRVALPCIVQSFDPVKQTITAAPAVMEKINKTINGVPVLTDVPLPLLLDIPIIVPRAGNFVITFPVQPGDECLVIFADFCIDSWYQNGATITNDATNQTQADRRRHDLSDGFAILGPWSQVRTIENYSTTAVEIRTEDGSDKISLDGTQVLVISQSNPIKIQTTNSNVSIQAGGSVTVTAPDGITFDGPVYFNGTASFNSTVQIGSSIAMSSTAASFGVTTTIQGKAFLSHSHTGVTAGASDTGGVA